MKNLLYHTLGYEKACDTELKWQILPSFSLLKALWRTASREHLDLLAIWWQDYGIIGSGGESRKQNGPKCFAV